MAGPSESVRGDASGHLGQIIQWTLNVVTLSPRGAAEQQPVPVPTGTGGGDGAGAGAGAALRVMASRLASFCFFVVYQMANGAAAGQCVG